MAFKSLSWLELAGVGSPRAQQGHTFGYLGLGREDSIGLKPASLACPGRDSNPHEGNPHRILSPVGGISKYLSNKEKSRRS